VAFTTTRGAAGTDDFDVKFEGSAGVDALFALNEKGIKLVTANAGNDTVDMFDESGVVGTATVELNEGNDIFTMGANSTITNRLANSEIKGGPGNDNITTEGTISSVLRGNEGNDDFFLLSNYTDTTINGNEGVDSFTLIEAVGVGNVNAVVLSNTKILGGKGNDGQMDFSDAGLATGTASLRAVDSVIQGGLGLDTITIGRLESGTSGFRVSGGQDNDTINVTNTNGSSDGVAYNGAKGDDAINFFDGNSADAVTKGGEGNDRFTIGTVATPAAAAAPAPAVNFSAGSGAINASGEAGNDNFVLNTLVGVQAGTAASGGGKHTVTGGAGADSYNIQSADAAMVAAAAAAANPTIDVDRSALTIVISSVADSAATTTGTSATFDSFTGAPIDNTSAAAVNAAAPAARVPQYFGFADVIDIKSGGAAEELVGNRLNSDEVLNQSLTAPGLLADSAATSFAALKGALDGNLLASESNFNNTNTGRISLQMVQVFNANTTTLNGYYAILNNTNTILDSGDMMFTMATDSVAASANDNAALAELAQIASAIEAGF
jgi:hypothetical protein